MSINIFVIVAAKDFEPQFLDIDCFLQFIQKRFLKLNYARQEIHTLDQLLRVLGGGPKLLHDLQEIESYYPDIACISEKELCEYSVFGLFKKFLKGNERSAFDWSIGEMKPPIKMIIFP